MATRSYEKMIEEIGNMSVLELADFVKALESTFGVSAAAMAPVAAPAGVAAAAPAAEVKSSYKVTLKDGGAEKIKTIKALREVITTLSLSDAKKAVDETPTVLAESMSKEDAEKLKAKLESVGAKVELA
jgi:large subunit ribosomal protein L7/L12